MPDPMQIDYLTLPDKRVDLVGRTVVGHAEAEHAVALYLLELGPSRVSPSSRDVRVSHDGNDESTKKTSASFNLCSACET